MPVSQFCIILPSCNVYLFVICFKLARINTRSCSLLYSILKWIQKQNQHTIYLGHCYLTLPWGNTFCLRLDVIIFLGYWFTFFCLGLNIIIFTGLWSTLFCKAIVSFEPLRNTCVQSFFKSLLNQPCNIRNIFIYQPYKLHLIVLNFSASLVNIKYYLTQCKGPSPKQPLRNGQSWILG